MGILALEAIDAVWTDETPPTCNLTLALGPATRPLARGCPIASPLPGHFFQGELRTDLRRFIELFC